MSMRPGPEEVLRWFDGDVNGQTLFSRLKELRTDPNWRVLSIPSSYVWDVCLVYWPTGSQYRIQLERRQLGSGAAWHMAA